MSSSSAALSVASSSSSFDLRRRPLNNRLYFSVRVRSKFLKRRGSFETRCSAKRSPVFFLNHATTQQRRLTTCPTKSALMARFPISSTFSASIPSASTSPASFRISFSWCSLASGGGSPETLPHFGPRPWPAFHLNSHTGRIHWTHHSSEAQC